jgi:hypothetical protein
MVRASLSLRPAAGRKKSSDCAAGFWSGNYTYSGTLPISLRHRLRWWRPERGSVQRPRARPTSPWPSAWRHDLRGTVDEPDGGLITAERLRAAHPKLGLLFLSHYAESHYLMRILEIGTESIGYRLKEKVGSVEV